MFGLFKVTRKKVETSEWGIFKKKNLSGLDLSGLSLSQYDFQGADLSGTNLSNATLVQCNFKGANLEGAKFADADVTQCDFEGANVSNVDFSAAKELCQCEGIPTTRGSSKFNYPTGDWKDIPDADRLRLHLDWAQRMAACVQGETKTRDDGDEVHVTGNFAGVPARVVVSTTFGSSSIELKIPTSLSEYMNIEYNTKQSRSKDEKNRASQTEWDDDSTKRLFLTEHSFIEYDDDGELAAARAIAAKINVGLVSMFEKLSDSKSNIYLTPEQVSCKVSREHLRSEDSAVRFGKHFELLQQIGQQIAS